VKMSRYITVVFGLTSTFLASVCTAQTAASNQPAATAALSSTPSAEALQIEQAARANSARYDAGQKALVLRTGATMKMSEMSPDYNTSQVRSLQQVNSSNIHQVTQQTLQRDDRTNDFTAQAYRTALKGTAASQHYVTDPTQSVLVTGSTRDPSGLPGTVSLTPTVYFISPLRDVVVVSATLSGGTGPARVSYEVDGANLPNDTFQAVSGTLSWGSGQSGTRTFVIPVSNTALRRDRVGQGEIAISLSSPRGAVLTYRSTGRVLLGNGNSGVPTPGCGTAGAPACPPAGSLPGATTPTGSQPTPNSGPSSLGVRCLPISTTPAASRASPGTGATACQ